MKKYLLSEIENLRVLGRTNGRLDPLSVFWTASGIEFQCSASEGWVHLHTDYDAFELWVDVLIDGALIQHMMLPKGDFDLCLFRNMDPSITRNIKILRDTQAIREDPHMLFQITGLSLEGSFDALPARAMRLEFIGDSITSGEGCNGAKQLMDWNPLCFHAINTYSFMTAANLNAEYNSISQSGWGVHCNWEHDFDNVLPKVYDDVCSVLTSAPMQTFGTTKPWAFSTWVPDAVIVNLGANDFYGMTSAGEDFKHFVPEAIAFLHQLRKNNPDAYILWAYGMLAPELMPYVMEAVASYKSETGDARVEFIALPLTLPGQEGAREHPGLISHQNTAAVLTAKLKALREAGTI